MSILKEILNDLKAAITMPAKELDAAPQAESKSAALSPQETPTPQPPEETLTIPWDESPPVEGAAALPEEKTLPISETAPEPEPSLAEKAPVPSPPEKVPAEPEAKGEPEPHPDEEISAPVQQPEPVSTHQAAAPAAGQAQPGAAPWPSRTILVVAAAALVVLIVGGALALTLVGPRAEPAPEGVVATYTHPATETGGQEYVTQADLSTYLAALPAEKRSDIPATEEGYRAALEQMIADQLLWDWMLGRLGPESLHHVVFDAARDKFTVNNFDQVLATIPIAESEIRQYFENHSDQFPGRTLSEVHDEILDQLRKERQAPYLQDYIAGLKANASLVEYPEALSVPEPSEDETWSYYQDHLLDYVPPRQATVDWLRFRRSERAREEAEDARADLLAGQDLATVAQTYARWASPAENFVVMEGQKAAEFDEAVFALQPGEISPVFDGGDAYYVVHLQEIVADPAQPFETVKEEIRALLWQSAAEDWFKTHKDSPLLVLEGNTYEAGDFYQAFLAMPADNRTIFNSTAGLKDLATRTVEWLLVLEDARHQGWPPEGASDASTRVVLLTKATGVEPTTELDVSDEQVLEYYNEHPEQFTMPTRFKIHYIAIEPGTTDADKTRAWAQAQEAYDRLTQDGRTPTESEFFDVARLFVQDPQSGNPAGWIVASRPEDIQVVTSLEELFAHPLYETLPDLAPNQVSPPFELDGVIYVVHVWDREEEQTLTLWDATNYLDITLGEQKAQAAVEELTRHLLEQANLVIYQQDLEATLP